MRLYKRGRIWWAHYGKYGRARSLETSSQTEARTRADAEFARLFEAARLGIQHYTWADAVAAYINESAAQKSLETTKHRLRWLHHRLEGTWLRDITTTTIERLIAEYQPGHAPASVNRMMAALSAVLHMAKRRGWINAVPYIRKLAEDNAVIRWLTHPEAAALLAELPPHLNTMAAFTLATGLRASNVQYLQWSHIDTTRRVAWIDGADHKSGRAHHVPLNDAALTVLQAQRGLHHTWVFPYDGKPVDKASTKAWHAALKRAGISNFRWHDLRHTWASWHVMAGTPLEVLMKLGGWHSLEMVMRYAHLAEQFTASYAANVSTPGSAYKTRTVAHKSSHPEMPDNSQLPDLYNGKVGWLMGLEPTTTGITKRIPNKWICKLLILNGQISEQAA